MSKNTLAIQESTSELKITRKKFEKTTKELQNTNDLLLDVASRPREARAIPVDVSDDIKERFELIRTRNSKGKIISYFMSGVQNRSSKNLLLRKITQMRMISLSPLIVLQIPSCLKESSGPTSGQKKEKIKLLSQVQT